MSHQSSYLPTPARFVLAFAMIAIFGSVAWGQQTAARPDRGAMPGATYQVSDLENISLQNGNANLSIPLAGLPPIAGGKLSWGLSAQYNSKIWNMIRSENDADDLDWHPYDVDMPQQSDLGGWRISGQYQITIRNAHEDYDYMTDIPPDSISYSDYMLRINYNWYKVVLQMPDGSEHELRPMDASPYPGSEIFLKGYYSANPYQNGAMRYYSIDGSYIYAQVTWDNNWTVIMPDGTKVIQTTDGVQRIQDTNGNKIKIFSTTNGTQIVTHYQDEQTGREISYSYDPAANSGNGQGVVSYQTVTGIAEYIYVNFGFTTIQGQLYKVNDWIPGQINPHPCTHHNELNDWIPVVREIVLPQTESGVTRKFVFTYNSDTTESATNYFIRFTCSDSLQTYTRTASKGWGSLNQVTTPSGAVIHYTYSQDALHLPLASDGIAKESLTKKELTHDGTTDTWLYAISDTAGTVTNPDGSTTTQTQYSHDVAYAWGYGKAGLTYRIQQPFTKIEKHWSDIVFTGAYLDSPAGPVNFNPVVDAEYTTLLDAAGNALKMSAKTYQFDYNGNVIGETAYDWFDPSLVGRDSNGVPTGVPGSATILRTTSNTLYNPATSSGSGNVYAKRSLSTGLPLILSALQQTATGAATAQLSYDGYAYGTAPTIGNLTSKKVWDDVDNKWITTSQTYGLYGNLATATDARGKVTTFYYDDATHAVPNRVIVDPQNGTGTQTTTTAFDYYTGLVTSQTDANNQVSTISYINQLLGSVDPFGRPGVTIGPLVNAGGTNQHHRVTTTYLDSARQVIVAADLNTENDKLLKTRTTADMLGRVILSEQTEDGTNYTITAQKAYDMVHNVTYSSNPRRSTSAATDGWTRATSDTAGRVIEVATFSGAAQPPFSGTNGNWTGSVTTAYDANFTTVTDQAGKARRSMVDAFGRLLRVDEPDGSGSLGTTSSPTQPTSYDYDVLGNLRHVYQGSQTRTFTYDTLSRLRTAANPESGTITYSYDDNGNLTSKVDARSITTTLTYDSINRPTAKSYSDGTPRVDYFYDSQILPFGAPSFDRGYATGRLVAVTYGSGSSAGTYRGYDARGAVLRQYQRTDSVNYLTEATYKLTGAMATETYPSVPGAGDRRTVSFSYDSAARLSSLSSAATSYAPAASVSSITYAATSALTSETYGNNLIHAVSYNNRQQQDQIKLGTSGNPTSILNLTYSYGTTTNNGNLQSTTYAGGGLSYTQTFGYDQLNRLTTSNENGGASWSQTNSYDRYGNRSIVGGVLTFNAANNRISTAGYVYDASGNLTNDTLHAYTFDAENKISKVDNVPAYVYDGDGQRVRKLVGENTRFIYDISGQLVAEFDGSTGNLKKEYVQGGETLITIEPTAVNSNGTRYTTSDHLGSPRVVTNSSAGVVSRHDYQPFGAELGIGIGGRTTGMGYSVADGLRQKFTSKERDNETGLDYFDARYYASMQGRFTSADPLLVSGRPGLPQSWNRYTYVLNNPGRLIDPTGMAEVPAGDPNEDQQTQQPPRRPPPSVVDLRKDPTITQAVDTIRANGSPLPKGEAPTLSNVIMIVGDTTTVKNGTLIDAYGNESPGFTGTVRPVAVIPLDQGGNVIPQGKGVFVAEYVETRSGEPPDTTAPAPSPPGGVFIDIHTITPGKSKTTIEQNVEVGQGRTRFQIGPNKITKDPNAGTISVTKGPTKQLR